jgi:hypothetical protein
MQTQHKHHTGEKSRTEYTRIITPGYPRAKYNRRTKEVKTILHWGQLKLLICEIEFLTKCIQESKSESKELNVVYAGAAPGIHIELYTTMFPEWTFHLYDPRDFTIQETEHIKIYNKYYTPDDAKTVSADIFISDIRTTADEKDVDSDMQLQLQLYEEIKAKFSLLKFRLPWTDGTTIYPDGEIYLQPFVGPTSTETRLMIRGSPSYKQYDHKKYEENLFFYNICIRFRIPMTTAPKINESGLCDCYDCVVCRKVLADYATVGCMTPQQILTEFYRLTGSNIQNRTIQYRKKLEAFRKKHNK